MRRQNEIREAALPGRVQKLDPARLPLWINSPDEAADGGEHALMLDAERMMLARRLGPEAMRIALPLSAYRGVAIRIVPGMTEAQDRVEVVLSHADPALEVRLFEADDDCDVIAEWRRWSTALALPLLMEGVDGHMIAAQTRIGEVEIDRPRPRRRHALLSGRRPRFLTRRRTGKLPLVPFVHHDEREIIAPE